MNRRWAAFCGVVLSGIVSARAAVRYDFESGTLGWVNDTTVYYNANFGVPTTAASPVHAGAKSLSVFVNFSDKSVFSYLNDAVYIRPVGLNLSASPGVTLYVYVSRGAGNGNPAYPLFGSVYIKTGSGWTFKEGNQILLRRNQWYKLTIDFAAKGVTNTNDVKEIGVHVYGGEFDTGTAVLTVDSVQSGLGDDLTSPSSPASLSATNLGVGNQVSLTWSASGATDLSHYNIYRSIASGALATKKFVTSVPAGQTTLTDVSVVDGLTYFYAVTAVDKSGNESLASNESNAVPTGPSAISFSTKGITFATWKAEEWLELYSDSALDDLKATGANYVSVVVTQYMANGSASSIARNASKTATDQALISVINKIHNRGMKVMLKPHVDVVGETPWRGAITPNDPAAWFASYQTFIFGYATLAQANRVERFCVGTELKSMTQGKTANWTTIINGVKARFSGSGGLTYAANAALYNDEFTAIGFWNQLDYMGLDLYFPLTAMTNPSSDGLKAGWSYSKDGVNILQTLADWKAYIDKDILITEIGYQSADGTNMRPFGIDAAFDPVEQKQAYEAAFVALNNRSWIQGLFWWVWDPNPNVDGYGDTGYSPQNKPALDVVLKNYGGEATQSFYSFEGGTAGWVADTTAFFADNFGAPETENQGNSMALRYPLNLNNKPSGTIQDYAYVEPTIPKDLSGYSGITASVLIPAGANIPSGTPATAVFVIQSSSTYLWFQSNTFRNLVPGQWREISMDFASATSTTTRGVPVESLTDIRRMGISLSGAGTASGSTLFYVDNVRAMGEGTIMGVSLGPKEFNLGSVSPQGSVIGSSPMSIENSGNVLSRYALACSVSAPGGWTPVASAPTSKNFNLNGQFSGSAPASFDPVKHAVLQTPTMSGAVRFAGTQRGDNVAPGDTRQLWFQFRAPQIVDINDTLLQTITLSVTAEAQ
ncbi:MAG: hypothetical protein IPN19_05425 [Elusimicrobia bacterium]|nr:hypothetical protein [Elusimicrobiota bacterium]